MGQIDVEPILEIAQIKKIADKFIMIFNVLSACGGGYHYLRP